MVMPMMAAIVMDIVMVMRTVMLMKMALMMNGDAEQL